jgi:hypothetical protein
MPDFGFSYKGYILYFTLFCIQEPMHAHMDPNRNEGTAAKIWVGEGGKTKVAYPGRVPPKVIKEARIWIKSNYDKIEKQWVKAGGKKEFYINIM